MGKNAPFYVTALYNAILRNISPTRCTYYTGSNSFYQYTCSMDMEEESKRYVILNYINL